MGHLVANYHTHNKLCNHAVGECSDYVKEAIRLNMKEIGLSDHDPIPEEFMSKEDYNDNLCYRNMTYDQFENIYLNEVDEVKKKYSNDIKIYAGLECEYLEGHDDYYKSLLKRLDYLNLGVHFFKDKYGNIINSYHKIDTNNVIDYANTCVKGMRTGMFKILVHPDLFMFDYKNINGERKFDENAIKASKMILEEAEKLGIYVEVNVNGLANSRKYHSYEWLYPYYEFWNLAKDYKNLKIVIGIDAHDPKSLDSTDIDLVKEFVKNYNLNILDTIKWD